MASTQRAVGAGVGAGAVGVTTAEAIQHAQASARISPENARLLALGLGVGTGVIGAAGLAGIAPIGPATSGAATGYGLGTLGWWGLREGGIAPRITLDIPTEVNIADPLVTAVVLGVMGISATTLVGTARSLTR